MKVILHYGSAGHDHRPQGTGGRESAGGAARSDRSAHEHQDRGDQPAGDHALNWWPRILPSNWPSGTSFRRTMKRAMETTMEAGAKGIKIQLAGRLGGSEMARREKSTVGSIPLSTLRAKIDYGFTEARTAQGHIGVQVWVNQGMYEEENQPMALMPKRVKHRKSQRGRIRGNATRGNRVVFGDFALAGNPRRVAQCGNHRSGPRGRLAIPPQRRPALYPCVSAQVDHLDSAGNAYG